MSGLRTNTSCDTDVMSAHDAASRLGWIASGAIAGAALAIGDAALASIGESFLSLAASAGLGLGVGGLVGAGLAGAERVMQRVPTRVMLAALPVTGAALGFAVAYQLGALSRLDGPYRGLAIGLLAAGIIGGACVALVTALMLAPPAVLRDRLAHAGGRLVGGGGFAAVALALVYADRTMFVGRYPLGHDALGFGALWFLACGARAGLPAVPTSARTRRITIVAPLALVLLALVVLDASDQDALRTRYLERGTRSWMLRALRAATDIDRDGYSSLFGGGDCAPLSADVHPGAREVPGNGVDDNCILGDARAFVARGAAETVRPTTPSPLSIVLITIDTFRADRTSFERTDLDTTPNLRAWGERALRFDRAYTAAGHTLISIPVLMRGVYSRRLLWTQLADTDDFKMLPLAEARDIPPAHVRTRFGLPLHDPRWPLSRWFAWRGMPTAAVVDDGWITQAFDPRYFASEFDTYVHADALSGASPNDDARVVDAAIAEVQRLQQGAPFFLWIHLFGLHGPNPERPGIPRLTDDASGEYDQAIRYLDQQLARLFATLEPITDRTAIIVTSDHGEHIDTKDRYHGVDMLESDLRVPLLVRIPGGRTGVDHTLVSTIDLFPTLLSLTQTPVPAPVDGLDLSSLVRAGTPLAPRILLADTWRLTRTGAYFKDFVAAFDGERKYIFERKRQAKSLVDQHDRSDAPPNLLDRESPDALRDALLRYLEESSNGPLFDEH